MHTASHDTNNKRRKKVKQIKLNNVPQNTQSTDTSPKEVEAKLEIDVKVSKQKKTKKRKQAEVVPPPKEKTVKKKRKTVQQEVKTPIVTETIIANDNNKEKLEPKIPLEETHETPQELDKVTDTQDTMLGVEQGLIAIAEADSIVVEEAQYTHINEVDWMYIQQQRPLVLDEVNSDQIDINEKKEVTPSVTNTNINNNDHHSTVNESPLTTSTYNMEVIAHTINETEQVIMEDVPSLEELEAEHIKIVRETEVQLTREIKTTYKLDEPNRVLFDHILKVCIAFMSRLIDDDSLTFGVFINLENTSLQSNDDILNLMLETTKIPKIIITPSTTANDVLQYINTFFDYINDNRNVKNTTNKSNQSRQSNNEVSLSIISPKSSFNYSGIKWSISNIQELSFALEKEKCLLELYDFDNLKWAMTTTIRGPVNLFDQTGISVEIQKTTPSGDIMQLLWNVLLLSILFKTKTSREIIYTNNKTPMNEAGPEVKCDFMRPFSWGLEQVSALSCSLLAIDKSKTILHKLPSSFDTSSSITHDILYTIIHTVWITRYVNTSINLDNGSITRRSFVEKVYFLLPTYILPTVENDKRIHKSNDNQYRSEKKLGNDNQKDPLNQGKRLKDFINTMAGISMKNQVLQAHPFEVHSQELHNVGFDTYDKSFNNNIPPPHGNEIIDNNLVDDIFDEISRESRLKGNKLNYDRPLSAIACSKGMSYEFIVDLVLDIRSTFLKPSIYTKTHDFSVLIRAFDFNIMTPYEQKDEHTPSIVNLHFFPYHCWWVPHEINFLLGNSATSLLKAVKVAEAIINIEQLGDMPSSLSMLYRTHVSEKTQEAQVLLANPRTRLLANPIYSKFEHQPRGANKVYNGSVTSAPTLNACYFTVDLSVIISIFLKLYSTLHNVLDYSLIASSRYSHYVPLSIAELYNQDVINSKNNRSLNEGIVRKCTLIIIHLAVEIYSRGFLTQITQSKNVNGSTNTTYDIQLEKPGFLMWVLTSKHLVYCPRIQQNSINNPSIKNMYYDSSTPRMRDVGHSSTAFVWYLYNGSSDNNTASGSKIPVTTSYSSVVPLVRKVERGMNPIIMWVNQLKENMDETQATLLVHSKNSRKITSPYYKLNTKDLVSRWDYSDSSLSECFTVAPKSTINNLYTTAMAEMLGGLLGDKNNCLINSPIKIYDNEKIALLNHHIKMCAFSPDGNNDDEDISDFDTASFGHGKWVSTVVTTPEAETINNQYSYGIEESSLTNLLSKALYEKSKNALLDALDIARVLKTTLGNFIKNNVSTTILIDNLQISKPTNIAAQLQSVSYRISPNIPRSVHQLSLFDHTATMLSNIPLENVTTHYDQTAFIKNTNDTIDDTPNKNKHTAFRKICIILKTQLLGLIFKTPLIPEFFNCSLSPNSNLSTIILTYHITKHGIDKYTVVYPVFKVPQNQYTFLYVPVRSRRTIELLLSDAVCIIKPTSK